MVPPPAPTAAHAKVMTPNSKHAMPVKWRGTAVVTAKYRIGRGIKKHARSALPSYSTKSSSKILQKGKNVRSACSLYHMMEKIQYLTSAVENLFVLVVYVHSSKRMSTTAKNGKIAGHVHSAGRQFQNTRKNL